MPTPQEQLAESKRLEQIASQQTGIAPVLGSITGSITGADFTTAPTRKITPSLPTFVPDIQSIDTKIPETQKSVSGLEESIAKLSALTLGKEARLETAGADVQRELIETNKQIRLIQAQALEEEKQTSRIASTSGFASEERSRVREKYAIETLRLSATAEALQGNITLAQSQAKRAVDTEFSKAENDIRIKRRNIVDNYDSLTTEQKKRADKLLLELNNQDDFVKDKKDEAKAREDLIIEVAKTGTATNVDLEKIRKAPDQTSASLIAAPFLHKPAAESKLGKPLSINQISQFKKTYGWTPPFGFSLSQLSTYMGDNPNATPAELEEGAREAEKQTGETTPAPTPATTSTPDAIITFITGNMSSEQKTALKKKADTAGISSIWKPASTDIKNYLNSIKEQIQEALDSGFTREEILSHLTQ